MVTWVVAAGAAYAMWAAVMYATQRRLIYPRMGLQTVPGVKASVPELVELAFDVPGGSVEGWFMPAAEEGPRPALLFTHGNGELIDYWVDDFRRFNERGLGVLLLEYPGYGRSGGSPSYESLRSTVLDAYDALADLDRVDASRIVPMGRSLGGGPAAIVAAEREVPALILMSTFTSLRPFAGRFLLPGGLVRDPFENEDIVSAFEGPVLIFHGEKDMVVPYWHGQALADAARDGTFISYDCAHNDCPPVWSEHVAQVMRFLAEEGIVGVERTERSAGA